MDINPILPSLQKLMMQDYPGDSAIILENMSSDEAKGWLETQNSEIAAHVIERISPQLAIRIIGKLDPNKQINILNLVSPTKLTSIIAHLPDEGKNKILQGLNSSLSEEVTDLLKYPPDSAGSLMDTQIVLYRPEMSVKETLSRFRKSKRKGRRAIFITDGDRKLQGLVEIQDLLMVKPDVRLSELAKSIPSVIGDISPQSEVVELLGKSKISELPVVNIDSELVGVIRYDTLVQAAKDDATADIQTMVGASKDERALSKISFAVKKRLPWLEINLITAFIAASVVGIFESTIAQYTALAILLPVVAGQSGNTGAQALAVTMRGLALREIRPRHWPKIVFKEAGVGLINGIAVALTTALGVFIWSKSIGLALIICSSMVISMVLASIAGASVPVVLAKLGQDPAQSSSIILTTITDVAGFFSFLGIATLLSGLI